MQSLNELPLVTVVIPTIGRPSLVAAVGSALNQEGVRVDVVVVDDSGSQAVRDLGAAWEDGAAIRVLETTGRCGAAAGRLRGMAASSGDLIALLDDDDAFLPGHLAHAAAHLSEHPTHIYACRGIVRDESGDRVEPTVTAMDSTASEYLFGANVWRSRRRRVLTPSVVLPSRFSSIPLDRPLSLGQDTAWLLSTELSGARLHVDPFIGVLVHADSRREKTRGSQRDPRAMGKDLAKFDPERAASAYIGRAARDAARRGDVLSAARAVRLGLGYRSTVKWVAVGAGQVAAAAGMKAVRKARGRRS